MKNKLQSLIQWKHRILVDVFSTFIEACIVLGISGISVLAVSLWSAFTIDGLELFDAFKETTIKTFRLTDMIVYMAAILASTTAYFIVRVKSLKPHIVRMSFIFLITALLLWLATPLLLTGVDETLANRQFALNFAKWLSLATLALWVFSLFSQRRIFEKNYVPSGDRRGREIVKNIGDFLDGQ